MKRIQTPAQSVRIVVIVAGAIIALFLLFRERPSTKGGASEPPSSRIDEVAAERNAENDAPMALPSLRDASTHMASAGARRAEVINYIVASWGSGLHELGHLRQQEASPEGPMSLAVGSDGRAFLLDQVNARIVRYGVDGKPEKAIKIAQRGAQDVAIAADGSIAVLDRLVTKSVTIYDSEGAPRGSLPLGSGAENPATATALLIDGPDVYVEFEHRLLVNIGDIFGVPASGRAELQGRPSRDGTLMVSAGIGNRAAGSLWVAAIDRGTKQRRFIRELESGAPLRSIAMLDSDRRGVIYLAYEVVGSAGSDAMRVVCIAPSGDVINTVTLPANTLPEETFRDFAVLDSGGVLYTLRSERGVTVERIDCR